MFTGIIENTGYLVQIYEDLGNLTFEIKSSLAPELKIDQSLAHNGVCLTVIDCNDTSYKVTAIYETLQKTNLKHWKIGEEINLERCLAAQARFDGHIVQGHVDTTAKCIEVLETFGSWKYTFEYDSKESSHITVAKGSICIQGVSLTVVESGEDTFSVAIIPYTYEHTNFKHLKVGNVVNLEFDIIGKYVEKMLFKRYSNEN